VLFAAYPAFRRLTRQKCHSQIVLNVDPRIAPRSKNGQNSRHYCLACETRPDSLYYFANFQTISLSL
jgi:hypothetical protein